jgi:hypothetical protein
MAIPQGAPLQARSQDPSSLADPFSRAACSRAGKSNIRLAIGLVLKECSIEKAAGSARPQQADGLVAAEQIEQQSQRLAALRSEIGIATTAREVRILHRLPIPSPVPSVREQVRAIFE